MGPIAEEGVTLVQLEAALRASWCADTAHSPEDWSAANPSTGQCWTTAYVVRHFLGGEIVLAEIFPHTDPVQRHAWNRFPSGVEVDLTREQLGEHQSLRECEVPEAVILSVSSAQAKCLLERVRGHLYREVVEP